MILDTVFRKWWISMSRRLSLMANRKQRLQFRSRRREGPSYPNLLLHHLPDPMVGNRWERGLPCRPRGFLPAGFVLGRVSIDGDRRRTGSGNAIWWKPKELSIQFGLRLRRELFRRSTQILADAPVPDLPALMGKPLARRHPHRWRH